MAPKIPGKPSRDIMVNERESLEVKASYLSKEHCVLFGFLRFP